MKLLNPIIEIFLFTFYAKKIFDTSMLRRMQEER